MQLLGGLEDTSPTFVWLEIARVEYQVQRAHVWRRREARTEEPAAPEPSSFRSADQALLEENDALTIRGSSLRRTALSLLACRFTSATEKLPLLSRITFDGGG